MWLTLDGCASSTVQVAHGTVVVHDLVRHRTIRVKARHRYTARP
jgi:hypothetical protein